jgi:hypothetical protein
MPRYNSTANQMVRTDAQAAVQNLRTRVTVAQINAGLTLLAAVPGYTYRLVDCTLIAIGGDAGTATDVRILGTRAAGSVALIVAAIAALTRSAVVKPNTANVTVLADGASFTALDANTAVTIGKTGGTLDTLTNVDVILNYVLEESA